MRLIEKYHTDFVRAGAKLSDVDKTRLREINGQLATLGTRFSQNVLAEVNDSAIVVDDVAMLAGLSEQAIAAAAQDAKARGLDGKYVIALQNTTGQPPNTYLENRDLRERITRRRSRAAAAAARRQHCHRLAGRQAARRKALMLGYPPTPPTAVADETAKTPEAVNEMLGNSLAAVANAKREAAALQAMIDKERLPRASRLPAATLGMAYTPRKCARRSTTSTNRNSSPTWSWIPY